MKEYSFERPSDEEFEDGVAVITDTIDSNRALRVTVQRTEKGDAITRIEVIVWEEGPYDHFGQWVVAGEISPNDARFLDDEEIEASRFVKTLERATIADRERWILRRGSRHLRMIENPALRQKIYAKERAGVEYPRHTLDLLGETVWEETDWPSPEARKVEVAFGGETVIVTNHPTSTRKEANVVQRFLTEYTLISFIDNQA